MSSSRFKKWLEGPKSCQGFQETHCSITIIKAVYWLNSVLLIFFSPSKVLYYTNGEQLKLEIEGGNMSITRSISVAQIDNRFEAR